MNIYIRMEKSVVKTDIKKHYNKEKNPNCKRKSIKGDIILISSILIAAGFIYLIFTFFAKKPGEYVRIKVDGKVMYELDLSADTSKMLTGYNGGSNELIIKDRNVYIKDADCPDKLCINMGTISKTGETIVCLPHRIVIEITDSKGSKDIDSLVR